MTNFYAGASVFDILYQNLALAATEFVPKLIIALAVLVLGWLIGSVLGKMGAQILKALKVDNTLRGAGMEDVLHKIGYRLNAGKFVGGILRWFVIIIFLTASFEIIGLGQVNVFLEQVMLVYVPQVLVAALVMLFAALIADALQNVVVRAAKAADVTSAHLLGVLTRWSIWIFAFIIALDQLGIGQPYLQTLFTGIVIALALAIGLSFGLGGQAVAADYLKKITKGGKGKE
jgi:small-conductance mechanosensitive channel